MKTLIVKLKQHTPLIHFQHDQYGATLRASEVKPQLDSFLLYSLGWENQQTGGVMDIRKKGEDKATENGWLIGKGEHPSLNYKMRIIPNSAPDIEAIERNIYRRNGQPGIERFPCFFANMGDGTEIKQFSFVRDGLTMELRFPTPKGKENQPPSPDLFKWISEDSKIAEFFFRYNFGTRGSKGFGSFYPDKKDGQYVDPEKMRKNLKGYRFFVNSTDKRELFSDIELFYKFLREGINYSHNQYNRFYCKPLIWKYCEEELQKYWEKKAIKTNLLENNNNDMDEYFAVRDLFGLSSSESWRSYNKTIEKEVQGIERMASPILFKPIMERNQFVVYINVNKNIKAVGLDKFKKANQITIKVRGSNRSINLNIPDSFSMTRFMEYFFNPGPPTFEQLVEGRYRNSRYYRSLKDIYDTIKTE